MAETASAGDPARNRRFEAEALPWLGDVTRFATYLTRDGNDAADLVQETFTRAFLAWHTFTPGSDCRGWLFTICRNTFYRQRRRDARQDMATDPELEALAAAQLHDRARADGLSSVFTAVDLGPAIRDAIARLPEAFREVVVLVDVNDCDYHEAATVLGIPLGTVRSRLFRGRRLLQTELVQHARDAGFARTAVTRSMEDPPE